MAVPRQGPLFRLVLIPLSLRYLASATYVDYSSAGFTSTPVVLVTYSTTSGNWSGDNGAIKVHSKTTSGCYIVVGGNFSTSRNVDWFAFGV